MISWYLSQSLLGIWRDYVYTYNGDNRKQEVNTRTDEVFREMQWKHTHAS